MRDGAQTQEAQSCRSNPKGTGRKHRKLFAASRHRTTPNPPTSFPEPLEQIFRFRLRGVVEEPSRAPTAPGSKPAGARPAPAPASPPVHAAPASDVGVARPYGAPRPFRFRRTARGVPGSEIDGSWAEVVGFLDSSFSLDATLCPRGPPDSPATIPSLSLPLHLYLASRYGSRFG